MLVVGGTCSCSVWYWWSMGTGRKSNQSQISDQWFDAVWGPLLGDREDFSMALAAEAGTRTVTVTPSEASEGSGWWEAGLTLKELGLAGGWNEAACNVMHRDGPGTMETGSTKPSFPPQMRRPWFRRSLWVHARDTPRYMYVTTSFPGLWNNMMHLVFSRPQAVRSNGKI